MKFFEAKIGRKVVTNQAWVDVPKGTLGYIIEDYGTGITVAWDLPLKPYPLDRSCYEVAKMYATNPKCPIRDGFDKENELIYLDLIDENDEFKDILDNIIYKS